MLREGQTPRRYSGWGMLDPIEPYCARWLQQVRCKFRSSYAAQHDIHGACFFARVLGQSRRPVRDMRSPFRMHCSDALCPSVIVHFKRISVLGIDIQSLHFLLFAVVQMMRLFA